MEHIYALDLGPKSPSQVISDLGPEHNYALTPGRHNRLAEHGSPYQAYPYAGFRPFPWLVLPLPDAAAGPGGDSQIPPGASRSIGEGQHQPWERTEARMGVRMLGRAMLGQTVVAAIIDGLVRTD